MGKRSKFVRIPRDRYETIDPRAIPPNLVKYLKGKDLYEPSVASGCLVDLLGEHGCSFVGGSDIQPLGAWDCPDNYKDGLDLTEEDLKGVDLLVTNPIYKKEWLLPLIDHWTSLKPVWLLLPSDLMFNGYFTVGS